MKKGKSVFMFGIVLVNVLFFKSAKAELKTFVRQYTYEAGEADSKLSSRAIALEQVKRELLEELGTYLESFTEVQNYQLTKDQIIVLTAGVVKTTILGEDWNGKEYKLTAKIETDPHKVIEDIARLRDDRKKTEELEHANAKADSALREIEILKQEYAEAKTDQEKESYRKSYTQQTDILTNRQPSNPKEGRRLWAWATLALGAGAGYGIYAMEAKADSSYKEYKASTNVDSMNTYKKDVKNKERIADVFIGATAVCIVTSGWLFLSSIHHGNEMSRAYSPDTHLGMAIIPQNGRLVPSLFLVKRF